MSVSSRDLLSVLGAVLSSLLWKIKGLFVPYHPEINLSMSLAVGIDISQKLSCFLLCSVRSNKVLVLNAIQLLNLVPFGMWQACSPCVFKPVTQLLSDLASYFTTKMSVLLTWMRNLSG